MLKPDIRLEVLVLPYTVWRSIWPDISGFPPSKAEAQKQENDDPNSHSAMTTSHFHSREWCMGMVLGKIGEAMQRWSKCGFFFGRSLPDQVEEDLLGRHEGLLDGVWRSGQRQSLEYVLL